MHFRFIASAVLAVCLLTAPSFAATPNWTGPYVGGQLGNINLVDDDGERLNFDTNLDGGFNNIVSTATGANAFSPGFCDGAPVGNNAGVGCKSDKSGLEIGLRAGYDWRVRKLILGAVGEVSLVDLQDSATAFSTTPASYSFKRDLKTLVALRGRVGAPISDFLLYGTGGVAWGDVDRSFVTTNGVNSFTPRGGDDAIGYQIGGGVERIAFGKFSLGAEYLYTSLDDEGFTMRFGPGNAPLTNAFRIVNPDGTDVQRSNDSIEFHSVRLTLNYRFGR